MIIEIKELGYVKDVRVNLSKDLIVLCGPNNTGKTYVAYAIYGLMKQTFRSVPLKKIRDDIESILTKGNSEIDLFEIWGKYNSQILDRFCKDFTDEIYNVFASNRDFFSKTTLKIELNNSDDFKQKILSEEIDSEIRYTRDTTISLKKVKNSAKLRCVFIADKSTGPTLPASVFISTIAREIQGFFLGTLFPKSHIAPAERIAINLFSKELSLQRNVLVDQLLELKEGRKHNDPYDLISRRATRYPLPVRDCLELAEDLNNFKKKTSVYNEFATEIEESILKGKVTISKEGDVQFKPQKGRVTLPIHLSASAVKSLSSLVVYFRHLANENDFIIIDEPELNLHPDNQVIIARIIARIVNKGFKVLINTHSDYIIRELNNLIMLSKKSKYLKDFDYTKNEVLLPEQVEPLLFHYDTRKVESLLVTEMGFEVETIDKITNDLNNRSQSLYFDTFADDE